MLVDYNADTRKYRTRLATWKELFVVRVDQLTLGLMKTPPPKFYKYAYSDPERAEYVYWSWPAYPFLAAWQYVKISWWFLGRYLDRRGWLSLERGVAPHWFWPKYIKFKKMGQKIHHKNGEYRYTVDYDKYEKFGDLHWQWYNDPSHEYKPLVDESIAPFRELAEIGTLVDVGCGDGLPMSLLYDIGFKCSGVDSSELGVKIALMQHNIAGEYFIETAEKFATRGMEFDYLYSLNTIEHLDDPQAMVEIMKKVKKFGIIVTDDAAAAEQPSVYHTKEFTRDEFRKLFEGFGIEEIKLSNPAYIGFKVWNL